MTTENEDTSTPEVSSNSNDSSTESSTESSSNSTESSANESTSSSSETNSDPGHEESTASTEAETPPAYIPNFKGKALGKEFEVDEFLRTSIKDAETEKKVKDLYEKAHVMEHYKEKIGKYDQETSALKQRDAIFSNAYSKIQQHLQNGDLRGLHESFKINEDSILQEAARILQFRELPPEQQQEVARVRQLERQNEVLTQQHAQAQERYWGQVAQAQTTELQRVISREDIAGIAGQYDSRLEKSGAFEDRVIRMGAEYERIHGRTLPVHTVIAKVMDELGFEERDPGAASPQAARSTPNSKGSSANNPNNLPVIPSLRGSAGAAVSKQISSLSELRAIKKSFRAS